MNGPKEDTGHGEWSKNSYASYKSTWDFTLVVPNENAYYGNSGCWDFKRGLKVESILPKNKHTQKKSLTFEDWCSGEVSKSAKISLIFYVKNHLNVS